MASFELSPAFINVRKKLGNMVFYNLEGDVFARKIPKKRSKNTTAQDEINSSFSILSVYWKYLGGIIQESWNIHARKKKRLRGFASFIGANVTRQRNGVPLELSKITGESGLASFSSYTGAASGEIICEFTKYIQDSDKFVTFFRQKKAVDQGLNEITRVETQAGASSPFTIQVVNPDVNISSTQWLLIRHMLKQIQYLPRGQRSVLRQCSFRSIQCGQGTCSLTVFI